MQYYPPSIPASECPPLVPDNRPVLVCPSCGDTMQHLRTIPKLGARLEQFIFVCPSCEEVSTKEVMIPPTRKEPDVF
jgi:predicted metal-binding protein